VTIGWMDCGTFEDIAPLAASGAAFSFSGNHLERSGGPFLAAPTMPDSGARRKE
jgi:hypothetical protein